MNKRTTLKILIALVVAVAIGAFWVFDLGQYLTLAKLKSGQSFLATFYQENPNQLIFGYFISYVLVTALSLPGAAIMTLAGGAIFGVWVGTLIVSFASTLGATLAFLASRFLFKDIVQRKFGDKLVSIHDGIKKEGAFYLFTLRLIPVFPFFLINLLMGLTSIRTITFIWVSQVGMLAGTAAYVNAGTELSKIDSLSGILSPRLLLAFAIIGLLPLISKRVVSYFRSRKLIRNFKRPKNYDYNLVVIGGGAAGLVSSYIASAIKAKVALIEKHQMGGDCLNTGCVPSKAFIRSAKILSYIRRTKEFGLNETQVDFDFSKVMERVQRVVKTVAPHDSVERYRSLGVDCIEGEAKILSPYEIQVNGNKITTKNIIVATGARPAVPPIPGLDTISYLTSDTVWNIKELPKRLIVLGGGPIGCELAQSFARFGSQVHIIEMVQRLMVREDADVSQLIEKKFTEEGMKVHVGTRAKSFKSENGRKFLICEQNGEEIQIEFDEVLLALGRRAAVKGFGLEDLGVEINKNGTITHDEFLRTNYPNIYVCGDVAGPYQFTHTASHQAWYAAVNSLFSPLKKFKSDYRVIPWCTFTAPEVARVGLNEEEAKEKGIEYEISKYEIDDLDRAIAEEEAYGFIKVLTPPGKDKILGVTIVAQHAGEMIAEYVAAMKQGFGLNQILGTIHIYPTFSETNKYVAGVWKKNHAPKKVLSMLEKFHTWRRNGSAQSL